MSPLRFFAGCRNKDWEIWDKDIGADSHAGKVDFLLREVNEEMAKGTLKDL